LTELVTSEELYRKFESVIVLGKSDAWTLAVFEGSPSGNQYSWCSDCVAASEDLRAFLKEYHGPVKVFQFKVGSENEWEGENGHEDPFKGRFPYLSDLPTAVLFHGRQDVARTIAPRKADLIYLSQRAEVLEGMIEEGTWKPPARFSGSSN